MKLRKCLFLSRLELLQSMLPGVRKPITKNVLAAEAGIPQAGLHQATGLLQEASHLQADGTSKWVFDRIRLLYLAKDCGYNTVYLIIKYLVDEVISYYLRNLGISSYNKILHYPGDSPDSKLICRTL